MTNDTDQNNVQEICGSESDRLETQSGDCAIDDDNDTTPLKLDEQPLNDQLKTRNRDDTKSKPTIKIDTKSKPSTKIDIK